MSSQRSPRNLEQQRKRAKDLRRAHAAGDFGAAARIVGHLPRAHGRPAAEVLAAPFTLSEAQLVVAREAGFASWPQLRHAIDRAAVGADAGLTAITAAFAGDQPGVRAALARDPAVARGSLAVALALADEPAALALLDRDPAAATRAHEPWGWTPLLHLCCSRHGRDDAQVQAARVRLAARLLAAGADPNRLGRDPGFTAANVDVFDDPDWAPLEGAAAQVVSVALVRALLAAGAVPRPTGSRADLLTRAVSGGDAEILALAIAACPPSFDRHSFTWALVACVALDRRGMARQLVAALPSPTALVRPLHEAIRRGRDVELIEILLGPGADVAAAYPIALRHGHAAAARLLEARGARPTEVDPADRVIAACLAGDRAAVRRLAPAELRHDDVDRMLSVVIRNGRPEAVPLLLAAGLDPDRPDRDGETPLHLAVKTSALAAVEHLLAAGATVDRSNHDARTPLACALELPEGPARTAITARLLAAGASPALAPDREDMTTLFERAVDAVAFGDLAGLRALLDEEPALVHARSGRPHRATLLHYVGANGTEDPRQRTPENAPAIAELLLARGADPEAECRLYGGGATTTGLLLTSAFPINAGLDGEILRVLLRGGAHADLGDQQGPMIWAIHGGLTRSVRVLLEAGLRLDNLLFAAAANRVDLLADQLARGADVNSRFAGGYTALHAAASLGRVEAAQFLLAHGANPHLREPTYDGTPAQKAAYFGHADLAALIGKHSPE